VTVVRYSIPGTSIGARADLSQTTGKLVINLSYVAIIHWRSIFLQIPVQIKLRWLLSQLVLPSYYQHVNQI